MPDGLLSKYEDTCHGPEKWQKVVIFLRQSLEGPLLDFIKKQIDLIGAEKSSLALKCRSIEDKIELLNKQLDASEKYKSEYLNRYQDSIKDKEKLSDDYMGRINNLQKKYSSLEEKSSNLSKTLDTARQECTDWKRKYELVLSKQKAEEDQFGAEVAVLRSKSSAAEARLAADQEKAQSAHEEAEEWKRKYDIAVRETKNALEKAAAIQERTNNQTQSREAALREEFSCALAEKEEEMKEKTKRIEEAEQCLTTLCLELKAAESKLKNYDLETSRLKLETRELGEKEGGANETALSAQSKARSAKQLKKEAKRTMDLADEVRAEAASAQKDKSDFQRVAMERLAQIERAERHAETLERQRADIVNEVERHRAAERDALFKVETLEDRIREKEQEIDSLLQSNNSQRKTTVQVLETLLESECAAHTEANNRAEALSVQLQATQGKLDEVSQELTALRFGEKSTMDGRPRTASRAKRGRTDDYEMGADSVQDTGTNDKVSRGKKRTKNTNSPVKFGSPEDGGSVFRGGEPTSSQKINQDDYTRFTVQKLRHELTSHNFGAELLQLRNPNKKDIVALYERLCSQQNIATVCQE
ncbi:hypothetical protein SASPL_146206 [Salvia splendens]|uniref:Interferon-induced guanylate-binding protein 2 n=1 Tax=Salvia splendens TaxID=180675 RepID=A0A8X8WD64_SALSN|nr:hypothetical protein SASPL_146206 [Salvia splendens]